MTSFRGRPTYEFHGSASPQDSMYEDQISEAYFQMRNLVRSHGCYLIEDPVLVKQLSTRNYDILPNGKLKVEPKKMWKKRLKSTQSSDRGDGTVYCFYDVGGSSHGKIASLEKDGSPDMGIQKVYDYENKLIGRRKQAVQGGIAVVSRTGRGGASVPGGDYLR